MGENEIPEVFNNMDSRLEEEEDESPRRKA